MVHLAQVVRDLVVERKRIEIELERVTNALSALNRFGARRPHFAIDPLSQRQPERELQPLNGHAGQSGGRRIRNQDSSRKVDPPFPQSPVGQLKAALG